MGNDTSASAGQGRNQGNQGRNQGRNQGNQSNQSAKKKVNQNNKNQMKNKGKNQGSQNSEGRNQSNQGRNQGNQGRGSAPNTDIKQSQLPLTSMGQNQDAVPYNDGQMANQEISNVATGIAGAGTPVNPEVATMADNIRMNNGVAGQGLGKTRQAYFDAFRRANRKAKSVKLVNLACLQNKWKKYNTDAWGFDIPVAPVNAALKSCVYQYYPGKPGKYDNLIGMRPPVPVRQQQPQTQPQPTNTGIVGPQPIIVDTPANIITNTPVAPSTEQLPVIPEEAKSVIVETVQVPVPVPAPSAETQLVEKFIIGVDSNNQTMRFLMWITLILLAIIIIGFIYKTQKQKMNV